MKNMELRESRKIKFGKWGGGVVLAVIAVLMVVNGRELIQAKRKSSAVSQQLRPAPRFELKDASGHAVRLEDLKGSPIFIHFWASWCAPCIGEIPEWVGLSRVFPDMKFVAVSQDRNWQDAQKILPTDKSEGKLDANVISLLDTEGKVPESFGTYQFPETYLIDADLRILMKWVGPQEWGSEDMQKAIKRIMELHAKSQSEAP